MDSSRSGMSRLDKFRRLPPAERRLLVNALLLLWAIRLGLWLLPFRTLRRLVTRFQGHPSGLPETGSEVSRLSIERIVWAVARASRSVPQATCLTQACAAQILLTRRGYPASLRIGVAKGEGGQFEAHAWVETQGRVVLGGPQLARFTPLPALSKGGY